MFGLLAASVPMNERFSFLILEIGMFILFIGLRRRKMSLSATMPEDYYHKFQMKILFLWAIHLVV